MIIYIYIYTHTSANPWILDFAPNSNDDAQLILIIINIIIMQYIVFNVIQYHFLEPLLNFPIACKVATTFDWE